MPGMRAGVMPQTGAAAGMVAKQVRTAVTGAVGTVKERAGLAAVRRAVFGAAAPAPAPAAVRAATWHGRCLHAGMALHAHRSIAR